MIQAQLPSKFTPGEIEHDDDEGEVVEPFCTETVFGGSQYEPPELCQEEAGSYLPGIAEWRCGLHVALWDADEYIDHEI